MNILFLSVATGSGHIRAAEAIREAIACKYPASNSLIVDTLKYISPFVDRLVVGGYLTTVKTSPQIYRKLYEISDTGNGLYYLSRAVNNLFAHRIEALVREFDPSAIICTHPFPIQSLSILKKKNAIDKPVVAILTDYVTHSFWAQECIDAYVVAHDKMKEEMVGRGVPNCSVFSYGIPVMSNFLKKKSRKALLKELKLDDKPTLLVMGGSLGLGHIERTCDVLMSLERDVQVIVITGSNTKIKNKLELRAREFSSRLRILSHTNQVSDYMDVSDILITKPGGMTISETLVKRLPTLIISPIPGHEVGNARFLEKKGVSLIVEDIGNLKEKVLYLFDNPDKLLSMKKAAGKLSSPAACRDILALTEKLILR